MMPRRSRSLVLLGIITAAVLACQTQATKAWPAAPSSLSVIRGGAASASTTRPLAPPPPPRGGSSLGLRKRKGWLQMMTSLSSTKEEEGDTTSSSTSNTAVLKESTALSTTQQQSGDALANAVTTTSSKDNNKSNRLDKIMFCVYFCAAVGSSLPVLLLPLIAAEQQAVVASVAAATATTSNFNAAAYCASVASMAALGGGVGKLINGFVCQAAGGRMLASLYLIGISACTCLLSAGSTAPAVVGWTLAALEFFVSAMWPACSLVLANHFGHKPERFAAAITVLSLSSTAGTLWGKLGGTAVLPLVPSWRVAARCGAVLTMAGSVLMWGLVSEFPSFVVQRQKAANNNSSGLKQIATTLKAVMGSRLFWLAGMAHATTYLVRTSDRVLGALFHDATALPKSLCGLLTAAVTLGFVHGLAGGKAQQMAQLPHNEKTAVLQRKYNQAVLCTAGLGLFSLPQLATRLLPSPYLVAAVLAILSGGMASSLAFQFYQIPPSIATTFGESKAVCLSFLDAMGFFMSAFAWGITGKIVGSLGPQQGWALACLLLSLLYGGGGAVMSRLYPKIMVQQQASSPKPATA